MGIAELDWHHETQGTWLPHAGMQRHVELPQQIETVTIDEVDRPSTVRRV